MSRVTYVWKDGRIWERGTEPWTPPARSDLAAPAIRPDGMDAIRGHADGRMHDSKSAYYQSVKAAGCEIVGDDRSFRDACNTPREYTPHGNVGADVKRAIEEIKAR